MHAKEILNIGKDVTLISPSGDTDIIVLALGSLKEEKEKVTVIDGPKRNMMKFQLAGVCIDAQLSECLIRMHAFTGNDFNSSFYHRGKAKCMQVMKSNHKFMNLFKVLGDTLDVNDVEALLPRVEHFVCKLYSTKFKNVNKARYHLFNSKLTRSKAVVDIATLPPCQSVLRLHLLRSAYIAHNWKMTDVALVPDFNIADYGWNTNGSIHWMDYAFPAEVESIVDKTEYSAIIEREADILDVEESDVDDFEDLL